MPITRLSWWRAAGQRAAATALAALLPLAALVVAGEVTVLYAASVAVVAVLGSLATSLGSLPEADGTTVPLWRAVLGRTARTAGQVAAPVIVSAVLLSDVGWTELGVTVGGAVVTTLIRTLLAALPEDADAHAVVERPDGARESGTLTVQPGDEARS